jgi:hypothetical protein
VLERGEGPYVFDTQGRRYLDGLSSLFCCQLDYSFGRRWPRWPTRSVTTSRPKSNRPQVELVEASGSSSCNRRWF